MLKCVGLKTMVETLTTVTLKEKVNPMPDFQLSHFSNSFTFTNFITLTLLMKFIKRCSVPLGNPNKISEHHSSSNFTITNCIARVIIFKIMLVSWICGVRWLVVIIIISKISLIFGATEGEKR